MWPPCRLPAPKMFGPGRGSCQVEQGWHASVSALSLSSTTAAPAALAPPCLGLCGLSPPIVPLCFCLCRESRQRGPQALAPHLCPPTAQLPTLYDFHFDSTQKRWIPWSLLVPEYIHMPEKKFIDILGQSELPHCPLSSYPTREVRPIPWCGPEETEERERWVLSSGAQRNGITLCLLTFLQSFGEGMRSWVLGPVYTLIDYRCVLKELLESEINSHSPIPLCGEILVIFIRSK